MASNKFSIQIGGKIQTADLISQVQTAFDGYKIRLNIDTAYLKSQINSVLGSVGGKTTQTKVSSITATSTSSNVSAPTLKGEIGREQTLNKDNQLIKQRIDLINSANQKESQYYKTAKDGGEELSKTVIKTNTGLAESNKLSAKNQTQFEKLSNSIGNLAERGKISAEQADKLKTSLNDIKSTPIDKQALAFDNLKTKISDTISSNTKLDQQLDKNQTQFDKLSSKVTGMTGTLGVSGKTVDGFKTQLGEVSKLMGDKTPEGIAKASKALKNLGNEIQTVETRSRTGFQTMSSAIGKFTAWYLIAGVVTSIIKKLKDVVTQTIALDKAMTSLQMVTQYTDAQMQDLKQTYIDLAQEMGVAVSTVTNGADEFLRAGLSAAETNDALRASLILSSVANMDSATSTKYLIAAMNAYGLKAEELVSVVDKLSAVDIVAATSSEELGEALSLSASSAQLAGIELDKFLGMIATVSETTRQSASSIGNS